MSRSWLAQLVAVAFVPTMLVLSVASWVFHDEGTELIARLGLPTDFTTLVLFSSIAIIWAAEHFFPANPDWNYRLFSNGAHGWNQLIRDLFYLLIITQLSALLVNALSELLAENAARLGLGFGKSWGLWPSAAPFWFRVLFAFMWTELLSYWMHRVAHHNRFLWRFHSTHHVSPELTTLVSLHTHPVDNALFALARTLPLLLLGAGKEEVIAVVYFGGFLSLLSHANIELKAGPLGLIINYPRYHQVHHSADEREYLSNYGCHTVLWDRIFGTFREHAAPGLVIGVKPLGRRTMWGELGAPFYRDPSDED